MCRDSLGTVRVWSCTTYRCLWWSRVSSSGTGVLQLSVFQTDPGGCCHNETSDDSGCMHFMVTQSRSGIIRTWKIVWSEMRFECIFDDENDDDAREIFSFTRLKVSKTLQHVFSARVGPSGPTIVVSCVLCQRIACILDASESVPLHSEPTNDAIEGLHTYGDCTSISMVYDKEFDCMVVLGGYENGSIVVWSIEHIDDLSVPVCTRLVAHTTCHDMMDAAETSPCLALDAFTTRREQCNRNSGSENTVLVQGVAGWAQGNGLALFEADIFPLAEPGDSNVLKSKMLHLRKPGLDHVLFRQDGKYVAAACWDGKVRIYRVLSAKMVDVLSYHSLSATFVCFEDTTDSKTIAVGSRDGTVSLWSIS